MFLKQKKKTLDWDVEYQKYLTEKENKDKQILEDISKIDEDPNEVLTGATRLNVGSDYVFKCNFHKNSIEEYVDVISLYHERLNTLEGRNILCEELAILNNNLLVDGFNPIECMLYSTRLLNKILNNNENLVDDLASLIVKVFTYSKGMYEVSKIALEHIINNWDWKMQVEIGIIAAGLYKEDCSLIKNILNAFKPVEKDYKLALVKMILYSKQDIFLEDLIRLTKSLDDKELDDLKIKNKMLDRVDGILDFCDSLLIKEELNKIYDLSLSSRKMYNFILQEKNIEISSNENLASDLQLIKNGLLKEVDLDSIYESYFIGHNNDFFKIIKELSSKKVPAFIPFYKDCLDKNRLNSYPKIISLYTNLGQLELDDDFLKSQIEKYPIDYDVITYTKYVNGFDNYSQTKKCINDFLNQFNNDEAKKISLSRFIRFSFEIRNIIKTIVCETLEKDLPINVVVAVVRNFEYLLRNENHLIRDLNPKDSLFRAISNVFNESHLKYNDAILCALVRILGKYQVSDNMGSLLTFISSHNKLTERVKEEARIQIRSRYNLEEPS